VLCHLHCKKSEQELFKSDIVSEYRNNIISSTTLVSSKMFSFLSSTDFSSHALMTVTVLFPLIILSVFEINNSPVALMFLSYLGFVQYFGVYDIVSMCTLNMIYILPASILYCVSGTLISLLKWWIFVRRDTEKNKLVAYTGSKKEELFRSYVSEHSVKIQRWILLWPMALVNLFLGEIYRFVSTVIFENLYNKYVSIAMRAVSHLQILVPEDDMNPVFHDEGPAKTSAELSNREFSSAS